jgi:hypothetical protein
MHLRPDAGDERGVIGVGHRRNDGEHAIRIGAVREEAAQRWDAQMMLIGMGHILWLQAVDRDHEHRRSMQPNDNEHDNE